jgi:NUMOD3 motif-containing protein
MSPKGYVYWLKDEHCTDPYCHGYIGACIHLDHRIKTHKHKRKGASPGIPHTNFTVEILFTGPIKQCQDLERQYRPHKHIGWNRKRGGGNSPLGYKHSAKTKRNMSIGAIIGRTGKAPRSLETKENMRQAALRRYTDPKEHERTSKAVRRGLKSVDRTGANNAMWGRKHSEATKLKISETKRKRHTLRCCA